MHLQGKAPKHEEESEAVDKADAVEDLDCVHKLTWLHSTFIFVILVG